MISTEEYAVIRDKLDEEDRLRWARKVITKSPFTIFARCPNCDNIVHRDYNPKYCGHCKTPLDWITNDTND